VVQNSPDNTLPFKPGVFKVDEKTQVHSRDRQIPDHLGQMGFVECGNGLGVHLVGDLISSFGHGKKKRKAEGGK
jgi:hypothetical protein